MRGWGGIDAVRMLVLLGAGVLAASCTAATPPATADDPPDAGGIELVGTLALTLPPDTGLTSVSYQVTSGVGMVLASGTFVVDPANPTAALMLRLPLGTGEQLGLQGMTSTGAWCTGWSGPFNVIEEQAVNVTVALACGSSDAGAD